MAKFPTGMKSRPNENLLILIPTDGKGSWQSECGQRAGLYITPMVDVTGVSVDKIKSREAHVDSNPFLVTTKTTFPDKETGQPIEHIGHTSSYSTMPSKDGRPSQIDRLYEAAGDRVVKLKLGNREYDMLNVTASISPMQTKTAKGDPIPNTQRNFAINTAKPMGPGTSKHFSETSFDRQRAIIAAQKEVNIEIYAEKEAARAAASLEVAEEISQPTAETDGPDL